MLLNDIVNFIRRWVNHKDTKILYLTLFLGLMLIVFNPVNVIFEGNFQLYNSIVTAQDIDIMMIPFMSLISKSKNKVLYLGGSVVYSYISQKYYSLKAVGIGNAQWTPENYSAEAQKMIDEFKIALSLEDKKTAYAIMYCVLNNTSGIFTKNYGKATSLINNMIVNHNRISSSIISEKEFLDHYQYIYDDCDLFFLDKTNRGTVMSNICEILAPKIVMKNNDNILLERSTSLCDQANLSGQKNPEYSVGLFVKQGFKNDINLVIYQSDLKMTNEESLYQKLHELSQSQKLNINSMPNAKEIFGLNIFIVASKDNSEIILNELQVSALVDNIKSLALKYPEHFVNFNKESQSFLDFVKTGNVKFLNKSDFPSARFYRPLDFYLLDHNRKKFEETNAYISVMRMNEAREGVSTDTIIQDEIDI